MSTSAPMRSPLRRVAAASMAGNAIEYYDFSIYGIAAALVFPQLFFPESDPFVAVLATFGTMAVGYISRPLGAIVFGHFGDRIGRKPMLVVTLMMMGIATLLIGLLPTYAQIGTWAATLLVTIRVIQGIAFGGEWGGAILMSFEYAPQHRRGLFAAIPQVGPATGSVLGNAVFLLITLLPEDKMLAWGWRIPFLLSAVLVVVGLVVRLKIAESPEFESVRDDSKTHQVPLTAVLKSHLLPTFLVTGGFLGFGAASIVVMTYLVNYGKNEVGVDATVMLTATVVALIIQIPSILMAGHLSDRYGRRVLVVVGTILAAIGMFVMAWSVRSGGTMAIVVSYAVGFGVLYTICYGVQPALFADAFDPEVRFTGMSLGYQLANVLGSGATPIVAALLVRSTGTVTSVAALVAATLCVSLACLVGLVRVVEARKSRELRRMPEPAAL